MKQRILLVYLLLTSQYLEYGRDVNNYLQGRKAMSQTNKNSFWQLNTKFYDLSLKTFEISFKMHLFIIMSSIKSIKT